MVGSIAGLWENVYNANLKAVTSRGVERSTKSSQSLVTIMVDLRYQIVKRAQKCFHDRYNNYYNNFTF